MKKSLALGLVVLGLMSFTALAFAADVSGTWEMTTQSPRGERNSEITIVQDGNKITVTMPGMRGGDPLAAEGTIDGDHIQWSVTRETPRGTFTVTYAGTVEGDTMKGTVDRGGRTSEWTAKKK
jgi:hypothetical protein